MSATLTTANGILKEVYEGQINDQLQEEKVLMKRIESSSEGVFENAGGKYVVFPLRTRRNHGISYRAEGVQLADAGRQGYQAATETLRYGYQRVKISGQLIDLAKSDPQAFANGMEQEMQGAKDDTARDCNRIAWGTTQGVALGRTGILTRLTGAGAATATVTAPTTYIIEPGMVIDITNTSGVPNAGSTALTVVSAVPNATSFTVSAAVTNSVGDCVVRTGNFDQEPYGLLNLVDSTGTIHGVNSATAGNEYWRSTVDSTTTTLTEAAMIANCDRIRGAGGARPSAIFCSMGVRRSYFNLMTTLRRYNEPKEFSGGLIGLAFNYEKEIPVVSDIDAPTSTMLIITESQLKEYRTRPWYWEDKDGSVLKYVHNFDQFEALLKQYWQIVTHQRNAHAKMTTVTES